MKLIPLIGFKGIFGHQRNKKRARRDNERVCVCLWVGEDGSCSPNHVTELRIWPRQAGNLVNFLTEFEEIDWMMLTIIILCINDCLYGALYGFFLSSSLFSILYAFVKSYFLHHRAYCCMGLCLYSRWICIKAHIFEYPGSDREKRLSLWDDPWVNKGERMTEQAFQVVLKLMWNAKWLK